MTTQERLIRHNDEKEIRKGTTGCGNEEISVETLIFKEKRYSLIYRRW